MDKLAEEPDDARYEITDALESLRSIYRENSSAFILQLFFDAKVEEIVNLFQEGPKVDFKKKQIETVDEFISKSEVHSILSANFGRISDHWFKFSTTWNYNAYQTFMDMDKYLILIYLVQKSFRHYADILICLLYTSPSPRDS